MASIADRFIYVMSKVSAIDAGIDNNHPHRYPIREMRTTAYTILANAITEAERISDFAKVLKDEMKQVKDSEV